jgi:hypothetical protein
MGRYRGDDDFKPQRCPECKRLVPGLLIQRHYNDCFKPSAKARKRSKKRKSR